MSRRVASKPKPFDVAATETVGYTLWYWSKRFGTKAHWWSQQTGESVEELEEYHAVLCQRYPDWAPYSYVVTRDVTRTTREIAASYTQHEKAE